MRTLCTAAALIACIAGAPIALAQPDAEDLGILSRQPVITRSVDLNTAGVRWYRINPGIGIDDHFAFDFVTTGDGGDTALGLYDSGGALISSDEDDGVGPHAALSFNAVLPYRPNPGGITHDGRDGHLLFAGPYYLAVSRGGARFDPGFSVTPGAGAAGAPTLRITSTEQPVVATELSAAPWYQLPWRQAYRPDEPLNATIVGKLVGHGVMVYAFRVDDPDVFAAELASPSLDAAMFLFDGQGRGVTIGRRISGSPDFVVSRLSSARMVQRDTYFIAITAATRRALGCNGEPIWNGGPVSGERVPDGPGAGCELEGWSGELAREGSFALSLTGGVFWPCYIPCPLDYDQSGGVDGDDISAFMHDWTTGNPCADIDQSGGVDDGDIHRFFCYWFQLCPTITCPP